MLKVTILVPIYNVEQYIERCARSLFEQTYNDIEYVFVDDCSPDKSIELLQGVLKEYPKRERHVRIIKHEKNRGLAAARNTAVENCETDFMMHVDSDDWIEKDTVAKLVERQIKTNADIVTGQAITHNPKYVSIMERPSFYEKDDFVEDMIKPTIHHTIWGRLIRASLYKDNSIKAKEGVNIGEDLQVMPLLVYHSKKYASIQDIIYHYDKTNENSYMNQHTGFNVKRMIQDITSMEIVHSFFDDKDNKFYDITEKYLFHYYLKMLDYYCKIGDKGNYNIFRDKFFSLKPYNRVISRIVEFNIHNYFFYMLFQGIISLYKHKTTKIYQERKGFAVLELYKKKRDRRDCTRD